MTQDLEKAQKLLDGQGFTCVLCRGDAVHTATERGVRPLLNWLDAGIDVAGFSAADRVVGRATAFLYCLLGVRAVYANVMSTVAMEVLEKHGIAVFCGELVPGIINRKGTGPCPFEAAVRDISDPAAALSAIRSRLAQM